MVLPVSATVQARIDRLEIPFNRHGIDPYGIRKKNLAQAMSVLEPLYNRYFDVHTFGMEHIPSRGRAMLVGNHSGGWALDGVMTGSSVFFRMDPPRLCQAMAEKFMSKVPLLGLLAQRTGNFTGLPENAVHLLENERLLLVYPEGARGTEKLYPARHDLVDFGTGFLRLALRTKTPIIPVGFVGGGDAIPTIMNLYRIAKRLGLPYIPITPWGVALPRPTTLQVYFGEPLRFEGSGNEEDVVIQRWVHQVKASIAGLIERGVRERPGLEKRKKGFAPRLLGRGR